MNIGNNGPADLVPPGSIHHIGVIVADLDEAVAQYARLGFSAGRRERLAAQNVDIVPLRSGESWIELVQPLDLESDLGSFLETRGGGLHHVAYLVDDLAQTLARLAEAGVELIDREPRIGLHGWRIAFIHPRSCAGVLTELVERDSTI